MKPRLFSPLILTLTLLAGPALAGQYQAGHVTVDAPWSRPTPPGTPVGVGYMTIHNHGSDAVTLTAGETPVADRVSIHETVEKDGLMTMRPLPGGLIIPAGGSVELRPQSFHLMLESLSSPLKEGEKVPLTLEFNGQENLEVQLQVRPRDELPGHDDHSHHSSGHSSGHSPDSHSHHSHHPRHSHQ